MIEGHVPLFLHFLDVVPVSASSVIGSFYFVLLVDSHVIHDADDMLARISIWLTGDTNQLRCRAVDGALLLELAHDANFGVFSVVDEATRERKTSDEWRFTSSDEQYMLLAINHLGHDSIGRQVGYLVNFLLFLGRILLVDLGGCITIGAFR